MKSTEIHNGLPNKEVRDFLARMMSEIYDKEVANRKPEHPYDRNNPLDWAIKDAEAEIAFQKRRIELLHQKIAVRSLIAEKGWEEFDVSDETSNDSGFKLWLNFIGTEAEHNHLLELINGV